jgi:hypothetical protein
MVLHNVQVVTSTPLEMRMHERSVYAVFVSLFGLFFVSPFAASASFSVRPRVLLVTRFCYRRPAAGFRLLEFLHSLNTFPVPVTPS